MDFSKSQNSQYINTILTVKTIILWVQLKVKDGDGIDKYFQTVNEGTLANPFQSVVADFALNFAVRNIELTDGIDVDIWDKGRELIKYGRNDDLDSGITEQIWLSGGLETIPTTNVIDEIVSDNAGDTQEVVIEGHTVDGSGNLTFTFQTATLNGTTPVTLTTPLRDATRLYNNDSTDFSGTVSVSDGATDYLVTDGANNQSLKCAASMGSDTYYIITKMTASVKRANSAIVDFQLQTREKGKVWRTRYSFSVSRDAGTFQVDLAPYIIMKPSSDMRVVGTSNAANTVAEAAVHGYMALIQ